MKTRISKWFSLAVIIALSFSLMTACTMNRGDTAGGGGDGQMEQQRFNPAPINQNMGTMDQNTRQDNRGQDNNWIAESQAAAETISDMEEIDSASVLLTNRNAYVAVMVEDGQFEQLPFTGNQMDRGNRGGQADQQVNDQDVPDELKEKIAEQVRSIEPDVQNVYVSANPDFVGQINNYMTDLREGRPLTGLMDELDDIVGRMFPENALNQNGNQMNRR